MQQITGQQLRYQSVCEKNNRICCYCVKSLLTENFRLDQESSWASIQNETGTVQGYYNSLGDGSIQGVPLDNAHLRKLAQNVVEIYYIQFVVIMNIFLVIFISIYIQPSFVCLKTCNI